MNNTEAVINLHKLFFTWQDYMAFSSLLVISAAIGIYFGCFGSRQKTAAEYLFGGRKMSVLPVAISLIASNMSGNTILGTPSEIYVYGTQYLVLCLSLVIVCIIMTTVFIPIFHKLQMTSSFEYFQIRFNKSVRIIASILFTIYQVLYVSIVIYVPALAFSQVAGVSVHLITPIVSGICIFYTTLGGIKAVVWTDFIQQIIIFAASILVIVLGLIRIGGFSNMWHINEAGQRIQFFNMDPSIFARMTFLNATIGWTFSYLSACGVSQQVIQRFLAVPTLKDAKKTMIILTIGLIIFKSMSCLTGLLIYAQYHDCDPLSIKAITKQDQLLPYYVMDIGGQIPGFPGLFVAGVFSAALSSMSTCLNSISGTLFEDFVAPCLSQEIREKHVDTFLKIIVVTLGSLSVAMVFLIEQLGGVVQMSVSMVSITVGALLGLFSLGMLCPWANAKGAIAGGLTSLFLVGTMVVGSQIAVAAKQIVYPTKPMSTAGCNLLLNATTDISHSQEETVPEEPFVLFRISFMYFNTIGCLTVLIIGSIVSWLTRATSPENVNRDLLSPIIYKWLPNGKINKQTVVIDPIQIFK